MKLDHIAVSVSDLDAAIARYEALGLTLERVEEVPTERAKVAFFDIGGGHLELVAPTDPDSAIAKSIDKRGPGLHHLCLEVPDIRQALVALEAAGLQVVGEAPRPGAGGSQVAFVHPKSMGGVLLELVQRAC